MPVATSVQPSFEELGTPLFETEFVVIDIETTGGSPDADRITEIGALKSKGGQVIGTFETLVRPSESIPPFIEYLTGISNSMVAPAPPIEGILPSLWEFTRDAVLVAHNARFDSSFLAAAFERHGYEVPFKRSVCTLRMARWLLKGETRDLRLQTLAGTLGLATVPCHRAFPDARATFELFHRLLEVAGPLGVTTCEDLFAFTKGGRRPDVAKVGLAASIPRAGGVYKFVDIKGRVLYVGKAKNLRARVRSYFYGDERPRMRDLVKDVAKIEIERCETDVSSEVRELHLIRQHEPRYNRRGRARGRTQVWVKITSEAVPRFVVARTTDAKSKLAFGPFGTQLRAKEIIDCISAVTPIARCSDPKKHPNGCAFGEMGHCLAPCRPDRRSQYASLIDELVSDIETEAASGVCSRLETRMNDYGEQMRYEAAALTRDRLSLLQSQLVRGHQVKALKAAGDFVICVPRPEGTEFTAIRRGKLISSNISQNRIDSRSLFALAPSSDDGEWITREDEEEALILWRYLKSAASNGGWIEYCSGSLSLPLVLGPIIRGQRERKSAESTNSPSL